MNSLPLRLSPGADLRRGIEDAVAAAGWGSAFVVAGIGSLRAAQIRFAAAADATPLVRDLEIVGLAGSVSPDGAHLHITVADGVGAVLGGHVAYGCVVRTTAELLLATSADWSLARAPDPATGYGELVVTTRT